MDIFISETTAFFCFLVYASFFEWTLHKYLMHTPFWQYPFRAHALVHHGLFRTGDQYFLPDAKVIRKGSLRLVERSVYYHSSHARHSLDTKDVGSRYIRRRLVGTRPLLFSL